MNDNLDILELQDTGTTNTLSVEKKQKGYWNEDTEQAVKDYLLLDTEYLLSRLKKHNEEKLLYEIGIDIDDSYASYLNELINISCLDETISKKESIFRNKIKNPINKLVESIIFTYKLFSEDIDVKTLHKECLTHVYMKFSNFDPDENTKSFSYFGTIAKHFCLNRKKNVDDLKKVNLNYENHTDEIEKTERVDENYKPEKDETYEMFVFISKVLENEIEKKGVSTNDKKVADAIISIFSNHEIFEDTNYSKQSLFNAIKEYTKLSTRDITYSLTRLRKIYKNKKEEFIKKKNYE